MKASTSFIATAALVASSTASPAHIAHQNTAPPYPDGLQSPITEPDRPDPGQQSHHEHWWDSLSFPGKNDITSVFDESVNYLTSGLDRVIDAAESVQDQFRSHLDHAIDVVTTENDAVIDGGHHDFPDMTIYQLISLSNYTTKFYKLVSEYPDIVDALNSTKANYTLFVPIDAAFEDIPDHAKDKKPSKEFIESVLKYHIGLDEYRARRILTTHTLPTALDEKFLGGEPQRLRTSVGLGGVRVNFYSKVVAADIGASNGVIHGVRSILVPPPFIGRIFNLFPSEFSTLLLAYEKTDFVHFLHKVNTIGCTVFAPPNSAFARLGPRVNAFLFNSDKGLKYLDAILKYHIAANVTLYSDEIYDATSSQADGPGIEGWRREHFDLKTLLDDTSVGVDIATLGAFQTIRVNGFTHVTISDGIGKNGVIQLVDKVLLPPCKHKHEGHVASDEDMDVEELVDRLADYVD